MRRMRGATPAKKELPPRATPHLLLRCLWSPWTKRAESATIDANGAAMSGGVFYITSTHQLLRVDPASGDIKSFDVQPPKSK